MHYRNLFERTYTAWEPENSTPMQSTLSPLQLYMYKMVGGAPFTRYMYKGQGDGGRGQD